MTSLFFAIIGVTLLCVGMTKFLTINVARVWALIAWGLVMLLGIGCFIHAIQLKQREEIQRHEHRES